MSRWSYFARRLVLAVPILLFATSITFLIIRAGPIDPAAAIVGPQGDPQAYQAVRDNLGLDEPIWQQYWQFMIDLFTLNLGESWVINPDTPVYEVIAERAPRTIWLGFWSVLVALFVGIPLGFYAGLNPNTLSDYTASFGGIVWRAMPNFWLAVILVNVLSQSGQLFTFGVPLGDGVCRLLDGFLVHYSDLAGCQFRFAWRNWLVETPNVVTSPDLGNLSDPGELMVATKQILPAALVLGSASMGNEMRIGRTAVLETINSNYVETARAKGVTNRTLVWKHVFRNALIPLVPIITGEAFLLIGGSVIVESVFSINGLGKLFFDAARQGDLPLVGSLMFIFILLTLSINILQDFLYTVIDPRIGYEGT